jgi:hypothetical protein
MSLTVFKKFPLEMLLQEAHPHYPWDVTKLQCKGANMRASQRILAKTLQEIFPPGTGKFYFPKLISTN